MGSPLHFVPHFRPPSRTTLAISLGITLHVGLVGSMALLLGAHAWAHHGTAFIEGLATAAQMLRGIQALSTLLLACALGLRAAVPADRTADRLGVARSLAGAVAFCIVVPALAAIVTGLLAGASVAEVDAACVPVMEAQAIPAAIGFAAGVWSSRARYVLPVIAVAAVAWGGAIALMSRLQPHGIVLDAHPNPVLWRLIPWTAVALISARLLTPRAVGGVVVFALMLGLGIETRVMRPLEGSFDHVPPDRLEPLSTMVVPGPKSRFSQSYELRGRSPRQDNGSFCVPVVARLGSEYGYAYLDHAPLAIALALQPHATELSWTVRGDLPLSENLSAEPRRSVDAIVAEVRALPRMVPDRSDSACWHALRTTIMAVNSGAAAGRLRLLRSDLNPGGANFYRRRQYGWALVDESTGQAVEATDRPVFEARANGTELSIVEVPVPPAFRAHPVAVIPLRYEARSSFEFVSW